MVEKIIKYGLPMVGAVVGVSMGHISAQMCDDPVILAVTKEIGAGIIFGAAGYNAQEVVNKLIAEHVKGGDA